MFSSDYLRIHDLFSLENKSNWMYFKQCVWRMKRIVYLNYETWHCSTFTRHTSAKYKYFWHNSWKYFESIRWQDQQPRFPIPNYATFSINTEEGCRNWIILLSARVIILVSLNHVLSHQEMSDVSNMFHLASYRIISDCSLMKIVQGDDNQINAHFTASSAGPEREDMKKDAWIVLRCLVCCC